MSNLLPQDKAYYTGKKNVYTCPECKAKTPTVDLSKGVTPFMIQCPACKEGMAQSEMYRVPQNLLPKREFYTPGKKEYRKLDLGMKEHVDQGGLLIRPVPTATTRRLRATGSFSEEMPTTTIAKVDLDGDGYVKMEQV